GWVGAALAGMLGRHPAAGDLRIAVVETRPFSADLRGELFDTRVIALAESSRHLLADAGVWTDELAARACPYRRMVVRDSAGTGCIEFDCAEVHRPDLGHIVENAALLGPLHRALEGLDHARSLADRIDDYAWCGTGMTAWCSASPTGASSARPWWWRRMAPSPWCGSAAASPCAAGTTATAPSSPRCGARGPTTSSPASGLPPRGPWPFCPCARRTGIVAMSPSSGPRTTTRPHG